MPNLKVFDVVALPVQLSLRMLIIKPWLLRFMAWYEQIHFSAEATSPFPTETTKQML